MPYGWPRLSGLHLQNERWHWSSHKPDFLQTICWWYLCKKKKNTKDQFFENLDTHHGKLKLVIEVSSAKFLDSENSAITTKVYVKSEKFPVYWSSKVFLTYKPNAL